MKQPSVVFLVSAALLALSACHSYHVDATVTNRTGQRIQLLEVTYPSASFGANSMEPGEVIHAPIQFRNEGKAHVHYIGPAGAAIEIDGPEFHENQEGSLEIILLPAGQAQFNPNFVGGH